MYDLSIDAARVTGVAEAFIREQVDALERDGVVLGVSGGVDSSVSAALAARALGAERVLGLLLPERDSSDHSLEDGRLLMEQLDVPYEVIDLTAMLTELGIYKKAPLRLLVNKRVRAEAVRKTRGLYERMLGENPFMAGLRGTRGCPGQRVLDAGHAYARSKHRMRMINLYFRAELENRLVVGSVNRTEILTGAMVKWGDIAADANPLLPLFKTQVVALAHHLGVPRPIIEKPPTADVMPGVDDEMALGMGYELLDQILCGLEGGDQPRDVAEQADTSVETVHRVMEMRYRSTHMSQMPSAPVYPLGAAARTALASARTRPGRPAP